MLETLSPGQNMGEYAVLREPSFHLSFLNWHPFQSLTLLILLLNCSLKQMLLTTPTLVRISNSHNLYRYSHTSFCPILWSLNQPSTHSNLHPHEVTHSPSLIYLLPQHFNLLARMSVDLTSTLFTQNFNNCSPPTIYEQLKASNTLITSICQPTQFINLLTHTTIPHQFPSLPTFLT